MPEALFAGLYGLLAASGLLLGAIVGLLLRPSQRVVAAAMAFGSGTLLSAVAFDLSLDALKRGGPFAVAIGFVLGGALFVAADTLIGEKGGFLRREGTRSSFLKTKKGQRAKDILERLAEIDLIRRLPAEEVQAIVPYVEERCFCDGDIVVRKNDAGDALYLVLEGKAHVSENGRVIAELRQGTAFGEMALLTDEPRNADVTAVGTLRTYRLARDDFHHLMIHSRALSVAVHELLAKRLEARRDTKPGTQQEAETWRKVAARHLDRTVTIQEERAIIKKHAGSSTGLAIFAGALVDGIPESLVIGATMVAASPHMSFLLAVFLQNFPEAMSSASVMSKSGYRTRRILGMWAVLVVLSGIAALLGQLCVASASPEAVAVAESVAGGAILALLTNTMMPHAFELGGRASAFCTIAGFLVAFLVAAVHGSMG